MRFALILILCASLLSAQARKTKNIVLVTADGLRWQEVFSGIDPALMNEKAAGMEKAQGRREKLWRPSPEQRRRLLMPFLWDTLAARGVILGNVRKESSVRVTNSYRVSYPGYSEILTGRAQDNIIRGNDQVQNPNPTVLEFLQQKLGLDRSQAAVFASWERFISISEHTPGSLTINAGYQAYDNPRTTPRLTDLSRGQMLALSPWEEARHDYFTFEMAMEYLKTVKPRALYIALDETDDWAHDKRYDRVVDSIAYFDRCLQDLFAALDTMPEYRGSTSVVVTVDHGRGSTLQDWSGHGQKVPGAEQIWLAIAGPDTPATGEAVKVPEFFQRDIAPTILDLMGVEEMKTALGKAIPLARTK